MVQDGSICEGAPGKLLLNVYHIDQWREKGTLERRPVFLRGRCRVQDAGRAEPGEQG